MRANPLKKRLRQKDHYYQVFGLIIQSEVPCPELLPGEGTPEVNIRFGRVPESLPDPLGVFQGEGGRYQAMRGRLLLHINGVAGFLVSDGREILVEPDPKADDDTVRLFVLGSALGAVLLQRGSLPLHGSAIGVHGRGIVFVGPSGQGKSTLAAAFGRRGHAVLSDDVSVLSMVEGNTILFPGYPQLKLQADALNLLGRNPKTLRRIGLDENKHGLPLINEFGDRPLPLHRIYVLQTSPDNNFGIETLKGMDKIEALIDNTYRVFFLEGLGGKAHHFTQCAEVARRVEVRRLTRPEKGFLLDELVRVLEHDIYSDQKACEARSERSL